MDDDRDLIGLEAGLLWSWATLHEIGRLRIIERGHLEAIANFPPNYFGYEERVPFWELRTVTHYCIVAARNLLRALSSIGPPTETQGFPQVPEDFKTHLELLRNCLEHWDDCDGRSFKKFQELGLGDPKVRRIGPGNSTTGGLAIGQLEEICREVHRHLLSLEADPLWRGWSGHQGTGSLGG